MKDSRDQVLYYRSPAVRARIAEYCGGSRETISQPDSWTALGVAAYGGRNHVHHVDGAPVAFPRERLRDVLEDGADVCRSLADHAGVLLQIDVDYVSPEDPSSPYLDPTPCFRAMEPIYRAIRSELALYDILPLVLMTGRGYHFIARVPVGTRTYRALLDVGVIGPPLAARYRAMWGEMGDVLGRAHEGAGRLAEYIAHRSLKRLKERASVPVGFADVPRSGGGPFVCLDLSAYGDPLFERYARCAFSTHQKASESGLDAGFIACVPRSRQSPGRLLEIRCSPERTARLAARASVTIPDVPGSDMRLVEDYSRSPLARFHRDFDGATHDSPDVWPWTYDALDTSILPLCARLPLENPNPALLRPVNIRTVAFTLWSLGWHPRAIAGLIRSKYERNFGWSDTWYRYDAAQRADFYVRLFCGALANGLEDSHTFNCATQAGRDVCPLGACGHDLGRMMDTLVAAKRKAS